MPVRQEPSERSLLRRLDLLAQGGQRRAPQTTQHIGLAPLALGSAGTKLPADELVAPFEVVQDGFDVDAEARVRLCCRERPAPARVTQHQLLECLCASFQERLRQAARRHHTEGVAVSTRVFCGDQPLLAGEAQTKRTPLGKQRLRETVLILARPEIAAQPELVVQLVRVARIAA